MAGYLKGRKVFWGANFFKRIFAAYSGGYPPEYAISSLPVSSVYLSYILPLSGGIPCSFPIPKYFYYSLDSHKNNGIIYAVFGRDLKTISEERGRIVF
jgi:hypothetical protein